MTQEAAGQKARLLHAFRALIVNPAWVEEIAPFIEKAKEEHNEACKARGKTPEKRAEHVEAAHLADELHELCAKKMASLEKELESLR